MILPAVTGQGLRSAIFILIYKAFYEQTPVSLDEAARVDGASEKRIFFTIGIPLGLPAMLTTFLFSFVWYVDLFPAAINGNQGKFGWDGEAYHFDDAWIEAVETRAEVINNKICEWMSAEEKEAVLGDPGAWPPGKGRTAMHTD